MPRSKKFVRPIRVMIGTPPENYVSVLQMKKEFGTREFNRLGGVARHGLIDSVRVVDDIKDQRGRLYVNPNTLKNLRNKNYSLMRERLLAVYHGTPITEKMRFEAERHFNQLDSQKETDLPALLQKLVADNQKQIDVVDAVDKLSVYSASPNSVQKMAASPQPGERFAIAMEKMVSLQEETLAVAIESRTALQKLQQIWS
jgi:hypothetical protein